jgi:hypothetical protein
VGRERGEGDEAGGAGDRGYDELVEVVQHRAGQELAQRAEVALVGAAQCGEVARTVALVDDRGRDAQAHEQEVEHKSPGGAVGVQEGVDAFEAGVKVRQGLGKRRAVGFA